MKNFLIILALAAIPSMAMAQDVIINDPNVTAGEVNSSAGSLATNNITGLDANVNFAASKIPKNTTVRYAPQVSAPSIVGGNPCMVSASLGGSVIGFGIAGGIGIEDFGCELRQQVALMSNIGLKSHAILMYCLNEPNVEAAFKTAGKTCMDMFAEMNGGWTQPNPGQIPSAGAITQHPTIQGGTVPLTSMNKDSLSTCGDDTYAAEMDGSWDDAGHSCKIRHLASAGNDR